MVHLEVRQSLRNQTRRLHILLTCLNTPLYFLPCLFLFCLILPSFLQRLKNSLDFSEVCHAWRKGVLIASTRTLPESAPTDSCLGYGSCVKCKCCISFRKSLNVKYQGNNEKQVGKVGCLFYDAVLSAEIVSVWCDVNRWMRGRW